MVHPGFKTDLASIPRWAQWLFPKIGRYDIAAVVHDWLYLGAYVRDNYGNSKLIGKHDADVLFYKLLRQLDVKKWRAVLMFWAVRIGGKGVWDTKNPFVPDIKIY